MNKIGKEKSSIYKIYQVIKIVINENMQIIDDKTYVNDTDLANYCYNFFINIVEKKATDINPPQDRLKMTFTNMNSMDLLVKQKSLK